MELKYSLSKLASMNNLWRDDLVELFIKEGYITDIKNLTSLGLKNGAEYMEGDNGDKWPIYGEYFQKIIDNHIFTRRKEVIQKPKKKHNNYLRSYQTYKEQISLHYTGLKNKYPSVSKDEKICFVNNKLNKEMLNLSDDEFQFFLKVIKAEIDGSITREEKYSLFGSKAKETMITEEQLEKAMRIIEQY